MKSRKQIISGIVLLVVVFAVLFIAMSKLVDRSVSYTYIGIGFCFVVVALSLLGLRWYIHLKPLSSSIRVFQTIRMECVSKFLNLLSPFQLSVPFRAYYLKKLSIPVGIPVSLSFFEMINDLMVSSMFIVVGYIILGKSLSAIFLVPLAAVFAWIVLPLDLRVFFHKKKENASHRVSRFLFKQLIHMNSGTLHYNQHRGQYVSFLVVTVLLWVVRITYFYCVMVALGLDIPLAALAVAFCLGQIAGFLSRVPSGLGVVEVTGAAVLSAYVSTADALAIFIAARILVMTVQLVLGGFCFFKYAKQVSVSLVRLFKN